MELLLKNNLILGGETSGHIINLELTTTGDGIIAALQVLESIILTGKNLSELTKEISKYPQIVRNIKFDTQIDITRNDEINLAIKDTENILANTGRVVLRPSGTESLIRIMVEGENENQIETLVDELADKVNKVTTRLH